MGRKALLVAPSAAVDAPLERFHARATDDPLLSVVVWTSRAADKAQRARQLAIARGGEQLLELQRVQPPEGSRSWFVGNNVQQDGSVLVLSPMDPLFVLLSVAWGQRARFMSVEDLAVQLHNSWLLRVKALTPKKIELVCDIQPTGDDGDEIGQLYVKASESKTLEWLRAKVERVARTLASQEAETAANSRNNGAFDQKFNLPDSIKTAADADKKPSELEITAHHRRCAIDMIGDYLPADWISLLYKAFNISKEDAASKTPVKAASSSGSMDDFSRFDRRQSADKPSKRPTPSGDSATKKKSKLANVDRTGMKSLTSFFTKK